MFEFSIGSDNAIAGTKSKKQTKSGKKSQALIKSNSIKPKPLDCIQIGQVVLCKLRGYCEWPALVNSITGDSINVTFFGDNTTARTTIKNCYSFADSAEFIMNLIKKKKNPLFAKSVREAEGTLMKSIFNLMK